MSASVRDPRPLLFEVETIIALAASQDRDLTPQECTRCDALLEAAEALAHLAALPSVGQAA
jgi:hypothetical protein